MELDAIDVDCVGDDDDDDDGEWQDAETYNFVQDKMSPIVIPIRRRSKDKAQLDQEIRKTHRKRSYENRFNTFNQQRQDEMMAKQPNNYNLNIEPQPLVLRKSSLSNCFSDTSSNSSSSNNERKERKDTNSSDSGVNCTVHLETYFNQLMIDHDISEINRLSDDTTPLLLCDVNDEQFSQHHVVMAPNIKFPFSHAIPALERLSEMFIARSVQPINQVAINSEEISDINQQNQRRTKVNWRTIIIGSMSTIAAIVATLIILL